MYYGFLGQSSDTIPVITPFQVVYKRPSHITTHFLAGEIDIQSVAIALRESDEALRPLKGTSHEGKYAYAH